MHLLFLDESGRLDQGGLFALGGIVVRDRDWPHLRDLWQQTLRDAHWPLDREVKWHGIRTGEVPALADEIFAAVARAPVSCFVAVMDPEAGRGAFPEYFARPEDTYSTALMFLAERLRENRPNPALAFRKFHKALG
jgi:hypothetical protein